VGSVTIISVICFLTRAVLLIVTAFNVKVDMNPYLILVYYLAVEIVPASLVLFILNKLPPSHSKSDPVINSKGSYSTPPNQSSEDGVPSSPPSGTNDEVPSQQWGSLNTDKGSTSTGQ